ncbi:MAG: hypothetical protein HLUCCA08_02225 [Rhodobacteraceae bacterium HLUCCA08]|nr:MAG: hypothetical protein HLUCCA08_02225 [Rhodobacteraceae bacterium HLUCCA08]
MKTVFSTALSIIALTACVPAPQGIVTDDGSGKSTVMLPGRQLLVFFDSGHDEPPTGGILVDCDAPSGICVDTGGSAPHALTRTATGWTYVTGSDFRVVLDDSGRGSTSVPDQPSVPVEWMTEPWS